MRRIPPKLLGCGILALGLLILVSIPAYRWHRRWEGHFAAEDYPSLRGAFNPALVAHMPMVIPADAAGVRIYAPGVCGLLPTPDQSMTVRMILPLARAAAIAKQAAAAQIPAPFKFDSVSLHPPGSTAYLLANPDGGNIAGVTVNPTTGEVIYWFFES